MGGGALFLIILVIIILCWCRRSRRKQKKDFKSLEVQMNNLESKVARECREGILIGDEFLRHFLNQSRQEAQLKPCCNFLFLNVCNKANLILDIHFIEVVYHKRYLLQDQ